MLWCSIFLDPFIDNTHFNDAPPSPPVLLLLYKKIPPLPLISTIPHPHPTPRFLPVNKSSGPNHPHEIDNPACLQFTL